MTELNHEIPAKLLPLYQQKRRFFVLFGGRGSGKSIGVADFLLLTGYAEKHRILCTREIQNSLAQSVHKLLCDRIEILGLKSFYEITEKTIRGKNGTEFFFRGLWANEDSIKSIQGITIAWVEESQAISRRSLDVLIPTIRENGSFIIFTMNPTNDTDAVYTDFVLSDRQDALKIEMNYTDNPFFPDVLRAEMEHCRSVDLDAYAHIWLGKTVKHSQAQVFFGKWSIEDFVSPEKAHFYYGSDFGFAQDPTTLIRCYINDNKLFIDYEAYALQCEINHLPELYNTVPGAADHIIIGDSARPETISYLKNHGFPRIRGAEKGKGSIEDGIEYIKSFDKIIVHPRCKHAIDEFRLYSYVIDQRSGQITNKLEDKNNHISGDALRYALEPCMKNRKATATINLWR